MFLLANDEGLTMYLTLFYPKEKGESKKISFFSLLKKFCHRGDVRFCFLQPCPTGTPTCIFLLKWQTGQLRSERALITKRRQNHKHLNFARLFAPLTPVFLLKECPFFYKNEPIWRISHTVKGISWDSLMQLQIAEVNPIRCWGLENLSGAGGGSKTPPTYSRYF